MRVSYRKLNNYKYINYADVGIPTGFVGVVKVPYMHKYFEFHPDGWLVSRKGYAWNGSNVVPDKHSIVASMFHDILYQLIELGVIPLSYREKIDRIYACICIMERMPVWRASVRLTGLRWLGLYYGISWLGGIHTLREKNRPPEPEIITVDIQGFIKYAGRSIRIA